MKKKIISILCTVFTVSVASALVVQTTTTTTTSKTEAQSDEIGISTYEISETPMTVGEAAWSLSRADAVVAMDLNSSTTVSEQAFALSSLISRTDKDVALNTFKELFNSAPSVEARVYSLIGIYALADSSEFNAFYNATAKDDTLTAIVSGKSYTVTVEKFFNTFKKNPQLFLPTSFPPKNLNFESSTSSTTSKTTTTSITFSTFPAVWYSDIAFWNPFPRPIIVFSHHKRPPHFKPRPIPPRPRPGPPPAFKPKSPTHKPPMPAFGKPKPPAPKPPSVAPTVHKRTPPPSPVGKPKFGSSARGVKDRTPRAGGLTTLGVGKKVEQSAKPAPKPNFERPKQSFQRTEVKRRPRASRTSPSMSGRVQRQAPTGQAPSRAPSQRPVRK